MGKLCPFISHADMAENLSTGSFAPVLPAGSFLNLRRFNWKI